MCKTRLVDVLFNYANEVFLIETMLAGCKSRRREIVLEERERERIIVV